MSAGKLYVVYSTKSSVGVGLGRSVINTYFAPRAISFAEVQEIEKSLKQDLDVQSLFLTSWQWLADDQETVQ